MPPHAAGGNYNDGTSGAQTFQFFNPAGNILSRAQYMPFLRQTGPVNLYPFIAVLSTGQIMVTAYRSTAIYTQTTYALANTTVTVPDLPRPVSYPYTASLVLLPLTGPTYNNRVRPRHWPSIKGWIAQRQVGAMLCGFCCSPALLPGDQAVPGHASLHTHLHRKGSACPQAVHAACPQPDSGRRSWLWEAPPTMQGRAPQPHPPPSCWTSAWPPWPG